MMRKTPERRGPGDGVTPVSGKRSRFLPFGNMTEAHADEPAHLGAEVEIAAVDPNCFERLRNERVRGA